jgi:hypothetical protein
VNPLSSLAACTLSSGNIRLFFQNGGNKVNQLTSESDWTSNAVLDQETAPGSSLAASITQDVDMNVFYESSPSVLSRIIYSYNTSWISGEYHSNVLSFSTLPKNLQSISERPYLAPDIGNETSLSISAPLTAIVNFAPYILRQFYIGNDKNIYEINNGTGNWSNAAKASLPSADVAGSQLAAVAWADQTRLYYQVNSSLLEARVSGSSIDPSSILGWSLIL